MKCDLKWCKHWNSLYMIYLILIIHTASLFRFVVKILLKEWVNFSCVFVKFEEKFRYIFFLYKIFLVFFVLIHTHETHTLNISVSQDLDMDWKKIRMWHFSRQYTCPNVYSDDWIHPRQSWEYFVTLLPSSILCMCAKKNI